MTVEHVHIVKKLLAGNDELAARNSARLKEAGIFTLNVIASPGSGKTSLISRTIEALSGRAAVGVVEGDVAGTIDTEKVLAAGAVDAVQINTGGGCHLEAGMVQEALESIDLGRVDVLFIENIGNLICPTAFALGEDVKVCLASAPEGDDKPVKYPEIFASADVVVLNKIDLAPLVDFDRDRFLGSVRALNPDAPIFEMSCRNGSGVAAWAGWILERAAAPLAAEGSR
ncbi:MAG TPA: hydrogenase nickel incorporation protein HypB [Candidatus Dormibacteraeota bacterium]|jgi:hydrogenase nickel incorporation protein HypB|nr:hydrogenase nickel incorporation protein HypB [Candidatus Dormibacteraeota bacterium]